ncbi:MAG: undecaprenyl-diphosphate phosphatase, partial [Bacteroidota bacterium]
MAEFLRALILGIVQGLTEFLPVSSSGHLELAKWLLQDDSLAAESMLMTVSLHAATALATIVVFRKDVLEILKDLFKFQWNDGTKFAVLIVVSMVPAAVVGVLFDDLLEALFDRQIVLVALMLILTGLLLFLADRAKNTNKSVGWSDAILVGIAQAVAILPGISASAAPRSRPTSTPANARPRTAASASRSAGGCSGTPPRGASWGPALRRRLDPCPAAGLVQVAVGVVAQVVGEQVPAVAVG